MKALVTGGGGFLGRYIVEQLLARGDEVTVFARGAYLDLGKQGAALMRGDIQDAEAITRACEGLDAVFHVAAKAGFWGDWDTYYSPNVVGTQNVIAACQKHGVSKLIYTSSPSVIFDNTDQEGVDETIPYPDHYESHYPHTKALGEQIVIEANGKEGVYTASLRPHLIFGPRDNHLLPRVIARAKTGKLPQVGNGTNKVDLTYVEDAARAHLLAADALTPDSPIAGSVYFISQDDPVVLGPWVNNLLRQLDIPPVTLRIPLAAARAAGAAMEATYRAFPFKGEPPLTRFLASELAQSHYYNIARAKRDFDYHPQFTMKKALEKTVAYLKLRV